MVQLWSCPSPGERAGLPPFARLQHTAPADLPYSTILNLLFWLKSSRRARDDLRFFISSVKGPNRSFARTHCNTLGQMQLVNVFCRAVEHSFVIRRF